MTRGNQRELARAKNLKKQQKEKKGGKESGTSLEKRKERDADIMRQKQAAKQAAKNTEGAEGGAKK